MTKIVLVLSRPPVAPPPIAGLTAWTLHLPVAAEGNATSVAAVVFARTDSAVTEIAADDLLAAYRVEERLQWDFDRTWPVGAPSPGVKRLSFLRAAAGLTRDAFADHWTNVHAPLARAHHPSLWRYAQNIVLETLTPDTPAVDGIAELSFRSREDMAERMYDSDAGRAAVAADITTFIDLAAGWRVLTTEYAPAPDREPLPRNGNAF